MIGRLNHVAIAVPDLAAATAQYKDTLGAKVTDAAAAARAWRDRRVRRRCPTPRSSCWSRLGEGSPIASFLQRNPGRRHPSHLLRGDDILAARDQLKAAGARVLGDGKPKIGAHGKPVLFLHPKDFNGTLVELEQA